MSTVKYILFDAANTLIHKPDLWVRMMSVFQKHDIPVSLSHLKSQHKIISELIDFPDQTSKSFYTDFNRELLLSLCIVPTDELLADIFQACTYLPWQAFEDTEWLKSCKLPMGVLSNFNNSLTAQLQQLFGDVFSNVFVSEDLKKRKPHPEFYKHAVAAIGIAPEDILYIGDSFKLDIVPALETGLKPLLIDRIGIYSDSKYAISSIFDIDKYIL